MGNKPFIFLTIFLSSLIISEKTTPARNGAAIGVGVGAGILGLGLIANASNNNYYNPYYYDPYPYGYYGYYPRYPRYYNRYDDLENKRYEAERRAKKERKKVF